MYYPMIDPKLDSRNSLDWYIVYLLTNIVYAKLSSWLFFITSEQKLWLWKVSYPLVNKLEQDLVFDELKNIFWHRVIS